MYSACKLNKHGDNIQPWCTPFPIWNQSVVPYLVLSLVDLYTGFSEDISLRIFQFVLIHTLRGFSVVSETQVNVFLEFSCFFYDPSDIGNLISGSSAFSKPSLYIWKFSVHVLLKPSSKDFEHYLASMWNEHNCVSLNIFWHCLSLRLEWKLTISSPVATAEISKFAHTLSAALQQHHLLGFEIAQLKVLHLF